VETIDLLRSLFAYNEWANRKVIESLKEAPPHSSKAVRLLAHLLITEREYFLRLRGKDSTGYDFWQELSLEECEELTEENHRNFAALFAALTEENLESIAFYKNSRGMAYHNTYREMLTHVLHHSSYHRGQVAMAARADLIVPAYTDYIAYLRESQITGSL
jgi:uncharacterized damage-inducible protein DinB